MRRLVIFIMIMSMLFGLFISTGAYAASDVFFSKISDSLREATGITMEYFDEGYPLDNDEKFSSVIWLLDVDKEEAVRYAIDEAEKTRKEVRTGYEYPYEVYYNGGEKDIIVDIPDYEEDIYVQTYIDSKRTYLSSVYSKSNNDLIENNASIKCIDITYVSKYSPCVFADITIEQIINLSRTSEVTGIGYWPDDETIPLSEGSVFSDDELEKIDLNLSISRIPQAKETYGVYGNGIKIGLLDTRTPDPTKVTVTINPISSFTGAHATNVCLILRKAANGAALYATTGTITQGSKTEWLLDQGVNIITSVVGALPEYNTYDDMTRWYDHIAYNHDVHFVQASGNYGTDGVIRPGMAYNIITVGNVYYTAGYNIVTGSNNPSSYNNSGASYISNRTFKPDICAPGWVGTYGGTSYSAPIISGAVALMCQYNSSLKTKQHIVKAILAANVNKNYHRCNTLDTDFKKYGAGILDAKSSLYAISQGHFSSSTGSVSPDSPTAYYNMAVTSDDTYMRVALAYANRIKYLNTADDDGDVYGAPSGKIGKVSLYVYSPNGTLVSSCVNDGANLKILGFDPTQYGIGTYKIKVQQTYPPIGGSSVTNFGVSWR